MPDAPAEIQPTDILLDREHDATLSIQMGGNNAQREMEAANARSTRINEIVQNNPDNLRAVFVSESSPPDYTEADFDATIGKLKSTEGNANTDSRIKTLEEDIEPLAAYLEAVRKSKLEGITLDKALGSDAETTKSKVAATLIHRGRLLEKFPEIAEAYRNEVDRLKFVEQLIARDPRFVSEMARELSEIRDEAKELDETTSDPKRLSEQKTTLDELQTSLVTQIQKTLEDHGLDQAGQEEIKNLIEMGMDPQSIIEMAKVNLKLDPTFERYSDLKEAYDVQRIEKETYEKLIADEKANTDSKGKPKRPDEIKRLQDLLIQANGRMETVRNHMMAEQNAYTLRTETTKEDFEGKYQKHLIKASLLRENGPLAKLIEASTKNQSKITELGSQIEQAKSNPEKEDAEKKKAELIRRLEASVDKAMAQFLTKKYDDYLSRQNIMVDAAIKEAEKDNEPNMANMTRRLQESMDIWSHFDTGTRKIVRNRTQLGTDIKNLVTYASEGPDGIRRMIAEKVEFKEDKGELNDHLAGEFGGEGATYDSLSAFDKAKVDSLAVQRRNEFDRLVTEQGDAFTKRLLAEYAANRGVIDKLTEVGYLSLNNDEINILNSQFGPLMDQELSRTGILAMLKEKGINMGPKTRLTLFLLILLGGAAAISAIGVAPAAVMAGQAAKEVGTATWKGWA